MSRDDSRSTGPLVRVVVAVLLITPFAVYLAVPTYAKVKPRLAGVPFFYWWQLLWVVITAVLVGIAYALTRPRTDDRGTPARSEEGE